MEHPKLLRNGGFNRAYRNIDNPLMNKLRHLASLSVFVLVCSVASATTVIPPSFAQLVSQAELIFQGTVTGLKSSWVGQGAERHIETSVTFRVEDAIKGNPGASYSISLLGGTVDGHTLEVTDTPKFKPGDRDILFVEHNGEQFVPLVGIGFGRFHVQHDARSGRDFMSTSEGEPLVDVTKLGHAGQIANTATALSPEQFKSAIKAQLGGPGN
ncbi:MAG TPA: hypothetical protein VFO30_04465 [Chthoniobacterales bacterium]|nr:hypothetical protein [Chthoniobacterales bacterium]